MFILIHQVIRQGKDKINRKIIFENQTEAIEYIVTLREHETIILFKQYYSRNEERRNNERIEKDPKRNRRDQY